ncbi:hypothetical protein H7X65_03755 [Candidatus Parcubacteria bacterium]|nr:hypothetical protein [Candidatus Parcubacteria bacterium]
MDTLDTTLEKFLLEEFGGTSLPANDHAALAGLDIGTNQTLADLVDPNSFEHIRIKTPEAANFTIIGHLVTQYYEALGYRVTPFMHEDDMFIFTAANADESLNISGAREDEFTLNISAVGKLN